MYKNNIISPTEVDFWLDVEKYSNFLGGAINSADPTIFNIDIIKLASIRKSITNFIRILTRKNIPVYFNNKNNNVNFDGKLIYISATINNKQDFDVAVGQALHEGAHSIKTDFDVLKIAYANIPRHILTLSDEKNIKRIDLEKFIHIIWNVIEDRFIDDYVFNEAPGYRGYYVALYNRYWNSSEVDSILLDPDLYKFPSLESYMFRIINLTNINTDLLALPRLEDIAKTIDITNISRLRTTKDRITKTFEVVEIVLNCLDANYMNSMPGSSDDLASPSDFFDFGDEGDTSTGNDGKSPNKIKIDVSKNSIKELSDILTNNQQLLPDENNDIVNKISITDISKQTEKQLNSVKDSQQEFLFGNIPKDMLSDENEALLELVEKHGIVLVKVDLPNTNGNINKNVKIDCIVVQKLTKELILSGNDIFPLSKSMSLGKGIPEPPEDGIAAVNKGISIGTKLGRKLQIRREVNTNKSIRKKYGKLNKRQLHEAGFDNDKIFFKITSDIHKNATLHITIDASSSMVGNKWNKTLTSVVAICKAASMIENIHVTVSFRTTQNTNSAMLPYVILAYDSKKDKFSKIKHLFPYLIPYGCTPEGLAFSAIMNLFEEITPDEEDRYFLNLSDGEPCYKLTIPSENLVVNYMGEIGVNHTKYQVDKIRNHDINILSYFISDDLHNEKLEESSLYKDFKKMYGDTAKFINVESIVDLSNTMNDLFLSREV